jgi:uncharacterized protein YkwD
MIGGLFVDAIVLFAIFAFEWAGPQLGATDAIRRAVACAAAFLGAALLRDPLGSIVRHVLGSSVDFSRLVAMLVAGVGVYLAASRLLQWRNAQRVDRIFDGYDAEEFGSPVLAAVDGGLLGLCWAVLFIGMLVLMPSDNIVSRAAVRSFTGGLLIRQEGALRWFADGFPHYTQTLPKGELGAVVGERDSIPMRGHEEPTSRNQDADVLLRAINGARLAHDVQSLTFNADVSGVARRQAESLVTEHQLSFEAPGGGKLDPRVQAALGETAGDFSPDVGIQVAWAHSPANAGKGLIEDDDASSLLTDSKWSEIGIGVADAGWFNGRIYVVLLVGPLDSSSTTATTSGADGAAGAAGVPGVAGSTSVPGTTA